MWEINGDLWVRRGPGVVSMVPWGRDDLDHGDPTVLGPLAGSVGALRNHLAQRAPGPDDRELSAF